MEINKIEIDDSIINEQVNIYNIQILSIGSNQDEEHIKLFGDIILPNEFNKCLILKVILYDKDHEIIGTDKFVGIGELDEKFLTFVFEFYKDNEKKATRAKFFLVEEKRF